MKRFIPFTLDKDGYPAESTLRRIERFHYSGGFDFLLNEIREIWMYADMGYFTQKGNTYWISTAGWSGNESIIRALQKNIFWHCCWVSSRRGGHYKFKMKKEYTAKWHLKHKEAI